MPGDGWLGGGAGMPGDGWLARVPGDGWLGGGGGVPGNGWLGGGAGVPGNGWLRGVARVPGNGWRGGVAGCVVGLGGTGGWGWGRRRCRGWSGGGMGVVFLLRYWRLRVVVLPLLSILTWYWWYCMTSTTTPVLSHLVGWCPVWFCISTLSPRLRGERPLVCSVQRFLPRCWRFCSAVCLVCSVAPSWVGCWSRVGRVGSRSLIGRPKRHMAGDIRVSGQGQFL